MSIKNIFVSDMSVESLRAAILNPGAHAVREEKKWRCSVCGNVHAGTGAQNLCPVCKRPASRCHSVA